MRREFSLILTGCDVTFCWMILTQKKCLYRSLLPPPPPPPARVQHYLKVQRALATLVIPFWPSASFWHLIMCTYAAAVQGYVLEDGCRALMHGRNTNSLLGSKSFDSWAILSRWVWFSFKRGRQIRYFEGEVATQDGKTAVCIWKKQKEESA